MDDEFDDYDDLEEYSPEDGDEESDEPEDGDDDGEGHGELKLARQQQMTKAKITKDVKKNAVKNAWKAVPIHIKLIIIGIAAGVIVAAALIIVIMGAIGGAMGSVSMNPDTMGQNFDGVKIIYRAEDEKSDALIVTQTERLALEMALKIVGTYGKTVPAGTYSIIDGIVVEGKSADVSCEVSEDMVPATEGKIYNYRGALAGANEAIVWRMSGGYIPSSANFDTLQYIQNVYMRLSIVILRTQLGVENIFDNMPTSEQYNSVMRAYAKEMNYYGYFDTLRGEETLSERKVIVNSVVEYALKNSAKFDVSDEPYTDLGVKVDLRDDTVLAEGLDGLLLECFNSTYLIGEKEIAKYSPAPRYYIRDASFEEVQTEVFLADESYISIIFMNKIDIDIEMFSFTTKNVAQPFDMTIRLLTCESLAEEGTAESVRTMVKHNLSLTNNEEVEISYMGITTFSPYIKAGSGLKVRKFTNNTPAAVPVIVGEANDYAKYFAYENETFTYFDPSTDYLDYNFGMPKGQKFSLAPNFFVYVQDIA